MKKIPWYRIIIFFLFSIIFCGIFLKVSKTQEYSIVMTLCGGETQKFEYFSSDYRDRQTNLYRGGITFSSVRFKPVVKKMDKGHRLDFGSRPEQLYLVSSIILEKPGYRKYILDLHSADQWIRKTNQMKMPKSLGKLLLVETTGIDAFFVTTDKPFSSFAKEEWNIPVQKVIWLLVAEVLLFAFLATYPWLVTGLRYLSSKVFTKKFAIQISIFVAVNLFVFIPLFYFMYRNLPDTFSITVKAPGQLRLKIYYKTPYSELATVTKQYTTTDQYKTITIPLPLDARKEQIRIVFISPSANKISQISIKDISIVQNGVLQYKQSLQKVQETYTTCYHLKSINLTNDGILELKPNGIYPSISPDPVKYADSEYIFPTNDFLLKLFLLEILLIFFLSQNVRNWILKISPVRLSMKENLRLSLTTAGVFTFVMAVSLPLQAYKTAEEIFLFKINTVLEALCIVVPLIFVMLSAILLLLNKRYGAIFALLFTAVAVLFTLECGILSFNLPELDGDFDAYHNIPRMILHLSVWLIGFAALLCFQKKVYSWVYVILAIVCVMNTAALIDSLTKRSSLEQRGKLLVNNLVPFEGTVEKVRYAKKNNVIMICLDAVTTEVVQEIFKNYPEYKTHYQGFTLFTNNTGMNTGTMWCVPGLFTGKLPDADTVVPEYTSSMYSNESALKQYIAKKYAVFFRVGLPRSSYIYPDQATKQDISIYTPAEGTMLQWMFHELYLFKIMPFFGKGRLLKYYFYDVWPKREWNRDSEERQASTSRDDKYNYQTLENAPVLEDEFPGAFHYHHFFGGHPPFGFDKDGNRVNRSHIPWQNDWVGYYERVILEFKRLSQYLNVLKKRGLYDDSVIIICADHGLEPTLKKGNTSGRYHPFLMVKCRNSKAPMNFINIPTSHTDIP